MRTLTLLCLALLACTSQQRAETAHAAAVFACEVAVLSPYVPEALGAEKLVEGIVTGQVSLPVALGRLGVERAAADRAIDSFNTCFAGSALESPEPEAIPQGTTSLRAPPPAYGNRVL